MDIRHDRKIKASPMTCGLVSSSEREGGGGGIYHAPCTGLRSISTPGKIQENSQEESTTAVASHLYEQQVFALPNG